MILAGVDIGDEDYWGLMGFNYCKRVYLDGCSSASAAITFQF